MAARKQVDTALPKVFDISIEFLLISLYFDCWVAQWEYIIFSYLKKFFKYMLNYLGYVTLSITFFAKSHIYIYIYIYVCVCMYVYIYIYYTYIYI